MASLEQLTVLANRLRVNSILSTNAANSGHPTSCSSIAEIMSVLFFKEMRYFSENPRDPSNDRFVLSKGHAAPILYAAWAEIGLFDKSELANLRKIDSFLEGHPTPRLSFVDVATGSLGQGLSSAVGMAYVGKYIDKSAYRVYCIIGDGESAEGSVWEAMSLASYYKLDNLVLIIDCNCFGQSQQTMLGHDFVTYSDRCSAFGFNSVVVDGHDIAGLTRALESARATKDRPTALIAKTMKGKDFPGIENLNGWHGKVLGDKSQNILEYLKASLPWESFCVAELIPKPLDVVSPAGGNKCGLSGPPNYSMGQMVATRSAYGEALLKLGTACPWVMAMDGDTKNSTFASKFAEAFGGQNRFIECFIAEQNMAGVAIGASTRDRAVVFASTFAAFWTRAFDQIRMGAISMTNVNFVGSHAGVSIGEDGPSQMALEDISMFRSIPGSTVFYPSDAVSTERAVELAANTPGICFIRTSRPNFPVIYSNDECFRVGGAKIVRSSSQDVCTVVAAGVTLAEAYKLQNTNPELPIRLIDLFCVKPLDVDTIKACISSTKGRLIVVEDHYSEGGIGEAVFAALIGFEPLRARHLCVKQIPRSGPSDVLLNKYGISASCIYQAVKELAEL